MSSTTGSSSYDTSISASASAAVYRSLATTAATISPTYRTVSTAIGGWSGITMSSVTGQAQGTLPCSAAKSAPEKAAITPDTPCAADTSTDVIRACACGLRRNATYARPGSV